MNSRKIGSKMFIFLWVIFSASCVMDQVDHGIIGRWETNIIHSTDLGSVRHVMDLKKNQNYTSYTYLDSGEVMIFAGSFFFKDGSTPAGRTSTCVKVTSIKLCHSLWKAGTTAQPRGWVGSSPVPHWQAATKVNCIE
jgi:hypothetical protein